ncbi:MAG: pyridoxamine 5'-phosphate oxidase family protein [Alphaproteobacteria bacterium]
MSEITRTERTRVKRLHERGSYERETIHQIIDEALIAHVGFEHQGAPAMIPTAHWRTGETIYIHGSSKNRMILALRKGAPCCLCVTLLDGLVLARSTFHHSMNYRSVILYGKFEAVTERDHKMASLEAFTEKLAPGRWLEARGPNEQEMKATTVLSMPIAEASAKIRTGPPSDDEPDYALPIWAGVVPLRLAAGEPVPDPKMPAGRDVPDHAFHLK